MRYFGQSPGHINFNQSQRNVLSMKMLCTRGWCSSRPHHHIILMASWRKSCQLLFSFLPLFCFCWTTLFRSQKRCSKSKLSPWRWWPFNVTRKRFQGDRLDASVGQLWTCTAKLNPLMPLSAFAFHLAAPARTLLGYFPLSFLAFGMAPPRQLHNLSLLFLFPLYFGLASGVELNLVTWPAQILSPNRTKRERPSRKIKVDLNIRLSKKEDLI